MKPMIVISLRHKLCRCCSSCIIIMLQFTVFFVKFLVITTLVCQHINNLSGSELLHSERMSNKGQPYMEDC